MSSTKKQDVFDATEYWTTRDFHTSARLHLQHWQWNYQLGYAIHPSIPRNHPDLRIADVAAGNGAWLIEISRQVPSFARLQGFDITDANFPANEWLPDNMSMHILDAFTPDLPADLVGAFDIVHIRAITSAVKNNNVQPLITNLVKMLRPGGYLQWDESDPSTLTTRSPNLSISNSASKELVTLMAYTFNAANLFTDWLHDLPNTFSANDLNVVTQEGFEPRKELMKVWTDNLLTVWEEVSTQLPKESTVGVGGGLTREKYLELLGRVISETEKGVSFSMNGLVIVGRKR